MPFVSSKICVEKLLSEEIDRRGVLSWPVWEKEKSRFEWNYDSQEQCLFLQGRVTVITPHGEVSFGAGDFVTFPAGLSCTWIVHEPVRKHYNFA